MSVETFGEMPDKTPVHRIRLRGGGLSANLLTYGAVLQDLRLAGHAPPLVLGFAQFSPYLTDSPYFGATVGRCANRVRDGHLELDGQNYQLDRNDSGMHHLHGGAAGTSNRLWRLAEVTDNSARLEITLSSGEMGYPGRLDLSATFTLLDGGVLDIRYQAHCDAPTLCNPAHHSYFILDDSGSISDHLLQVAAETYLPVDAGLIPTGEIRALAGTAYDFRSEKPICDAGSLDHNFCLSRQRRDLHAVAWLTSPRSGVSLEVRTTEPGLQIYDGAGIDVAPVGLTGRSMGARAGIALEPQVWPDANHRPDFPQAVLRPGQTYRQHGQFAFQRQE